MFMGEALEDEKDLDEDPLFDVFSSRWILLVPGSSISSILVSELAFSEDCIETSVFGKIMSGTACGAKRGLLKAALLT